jgi:hypothetical protein
LSSLRTNLSETFATTVTALSALITGLNFHLLTVSSAAFARSWSPLNDQILITSPVSETQNPPRPRPQLFVLGPEAGRSRWRLLRAQACIRVL